MIVNLVSRFLLFAVWLCAAGAALAAPTPVIDMLHTSWTAREGAPAGSRAITQTPDGWIWMGGKSGLYKFDGVRFLRAAGPEAPLGSSISAMGVLRDGRLWVGYYHGGISLKEAGRMRHFPPGPASLPLTMVTALEQDATGRFWVGTAGGLYYLDSGWHRADASFAFARERVHAIKLDQDGVLWVRSEAGLFALPKGQARFVRKMAVSGYGALAEHPDGSVWTNATGYAHVVRVTHPEQDAPLGFPVLSFSAFVFDREGYLWTPTGFGVGRVGGAGKHIVVQETGLDHGLSGNIVSAMFEDREQNFWVATESGLDRFRKPRLRPLPLPHYTLLAGRPVLGGPGGSAWVDRFAVAGPNAAPHPFAPDRNKVVTALYRSADGTVWGGGDDQLWTLEKTGTRPIRRPASVPANSLILNMAKDGMGALWVNFGSKGLYKWTEGHWSIPEGLPKPEQSIALALVADARGRIWVGFVDGRLALIDKGKTRFIGQTHTLSIGAVAQIVPIFDSALLAGENGIGYFDGKRFIAVTGKGGEPFIGVTGLVFTRDGTLWINGSSGISSISRTELQHALMEPGYQVRFGRLDYRDGLHGVAGSVYPLPSATVSDNGTLWFSTGGGVYAFDPDKLPRNHRAPPVAITGIRTGAKEFAPIDGSRLPPGTAMLRIDFTALSFQAPERMEFRYRLEGVDADWLDGTGERSAHYTNLGPGHYRFHVIASNNDGVWNKEEASLAFEIAPKLTQTMWFRVLCGAALVGVLIGAYLCRTRQLQRRYGEKLHERLEERERIARALHDTLLQGMQGLILKFQSVVKRLPREDQIRLGIEKILDQADMLMSDGRAEVLSLRSHARKSDDLPEALSTFGLSLQDTFGPAFALAMAGKERELVHHVRHEIYSIGREAIFNAYRHANADHIEVDMVYRDDEFCMFVRDDGKGMEQELLGGGRKQAHWGLPGMKERAAGIGASIELRNRNPKGVEVALRVPAARAYSRRTSIWHPMPGRRIRK